MKNWIKSLRLPACFFFGMLVMISFKISNLVSVQLWLYIGATFFISCAAMVQNDWRDRFHDLKKGKCLAHDNARRYLMLVRVMWIVALSFAVAITIQNINLAVLPWAMIIISLIYSETRAVFMLPTVLVALSSACSVLFPVFIDYHLPLVWLLFLSILLSALAREIVKDLEDLEIDISYKRTLPQKIGRRPSEFVAGLSMLFGIMTTVLISPMALAGLPFCAFAQFYLFKRRAYLISKRFFDAGLTTSILTLWMI
jgi:4-hydroxybenzoate polyprenyltransferase